MAPLISSSSELKKILKTVATTLLSVQLVALLVSGCKSEMNVATVGSASLKTKPTLKSTAKAGSQTRALYLANLDQLPSCSTDNEYQLVYVVDAKQFMTCQTNEWAIVNLDPTTAIDNRLLVTTESEPNGANCASGGVKILTGTDNGADGTTTAGDGQLTGAEVTKVNYVCRGENGKDSLLSSTVEPAGPNCAAGGLKIAAGIDDGTNNSISRNQILEAGEIRSSFYVCNGATGASGAAGQTGLSSLVNTRDEPAGSNCQYGGQEVSLGFDDGRAGATSNNGLLEATEIRRITYLCNGAAGAAGKTSLVTFLNEPAGTNCPNGGKKFVSGFDDGLNGGVANNNTLEESEIRTTAYMCNAAPGSTGATGAAGMSSLVAVRPEAPGNNCSNGGQKILSGYDDGQGG